MLGFRCGEMRLLIISAREAMAHVNDNAIYIDIINKERKSINIIRCQCEDQYAPRQREMQINTKEKTNNRIIGTCNESWNNERKKNHLKRSTIVLNSAMQLFYRKIFGCEYIQERLNTYREIHIRIYLK